MKTLLKNIFSIWPFNKLIYMHGARHGGKIAITFDDGPHPKYTSQVIDILKNKNIPATFFLEGRWIEKYKELALEIIDSDGEVGCHGYDHDDKDVLRQAKQGFAILKANGINTILFRPPLGRINWKSAVKLVANKKRIILWSFDTHDSMRHENKWQNKPDYRKIRSGDIILMHDDNPVCVQELPLLIEVAEQKGFKIVHVSEML